MAKSIILFLIVMLLIIGLKKALLLLTQIILPLFVKGTPFFWLFKRPSPPDPPTGFKDLSDLDMKVDSVMTDYQRTTEEVNEALRKAEDIKKKTNLNQQ